MKVESSGYFGVAQSFAAQEQQSHLFCWQGMKRLPHVPVLFAAFLSLLGRPYRGHPAEPRSERLIAPPPAFHFELVEAQSNSGAIQPAFEIGLRRRRIPIQSPERLGGEFLGLRHVAADTVQKPCQATVVRIEECIEEAGSFFGTSYRDDHVTAGFHMYIATLASKA